MARSVEELETRVAELEAKLARVREVCAQFKGPYVGWGTDEGGAAYEAGVESGRDAVVEAVEEVLES